MQQPSDYAARDQQRRRQKDGQHPVPSRDAVGPEHGADHDQQADDRERQRPGRGKPRQHGPEDVEINGVLAGEIGVIRPFELRRDAQHVVALLLQRALAEIVPAVERRVVVGDIVREREVEGRESLLDEQCEICVVGQKAIDFRVERTRREIRNAPRIEIDQVSVTRARLKQKTAAARAPCFHVHDSADTRFQGRILQKCLRTKQTRLLAIGDDSENGMQTFARARTATHAPFPERWQRRTRHPTRPVRPEPSRNARAGRLPCPRPGRLSARTSVTVAQGMEAKPRQALQVNAV